VATFMIGQNVEVLALYDTDPAGNAAKDKFLKNWLPRYKGRKANALSLGSAAGVANKVFSIEDLFPEDFYLSCVEEIYGKQLVAAGANFKILPHAEQLVKRVEKLFEGTSLSFNKTVVSKVLCRKIRAMKSISEVRSTTVSHVEILFENIRKEFAAFQSR